MKIKNENISEFLINNVWIFFLSLIIFWALLIFLVSGCTNASGETVSRREYDLVINDNNIKAKKITELQTSQDSLSRSIIFINSKFDTLSKKYDSLYVFAKTKIEILQDSLFGFKQVSDSTINDFLCTINKAIILNVDSIYERIKRNYKTLQGN